MDEVEPIVIRQWWAIIAEAETEFVLLENILGKQRDLPCSYKSDCKKEKNMVSSTHEQNIICSQTKLDEIGHEQTSGQFFCRSRGGLSADEKEDWNICIEW